MKDLTDIEKKILEEIQQDIPLVSRPFQEIAVTLGIDEETVIYSINSLKERGFIRDISAIYNAKGLGYKSTLVALATNDPDKTAAVINKHPGVSHNYYREHTFNVWFTLTVPESMHFESIIEDMLGGESYEKYRILPALKTFKIGVNFRFTGDIKKKNKSEYSSDIASVEIDRDLIRALQNPFPVVSEPWSVLGEQLGKSEDELFLEISKLKKARVIKRISGVIRHRKAGYASNGMACFELDEDKVEQAGMQAAEFNAVSHCYQRPVYSDWPYSLFAMTHGTSNEECEKIISEITDEIGALSCLTLYSTKEYKKERVKYFLEDVHV